MEVRQLTEIRATAVIVDGATCYRIACYVTERDILEKPGKSRSCDLYFLVDPQGNYVTVINHNAFQNHSSGVPEYSTPKEIEELIGKRLNKKGEYVGTVIKTNPGRHKITLEKPLIVSKDKDPVATEEVVVKPDPEYKDPPRGINPEEGINPEDWTFKGPPKGIDPATGLPFNDGYMK